MLAAAVRWLFRSSMLEVALALGLGFGLYRLAQALGTEVFDVVGRATATKQVGFAAFYEGGINSLSFRVGGTEVYYGYVVAGALSLVLVALAALAVQRARQRRLGSCPHCLSPVPVGASVCRFCTLELASPASPPSP